MAGWWVCLVAITICLLFLSLAASPRETASLNDLVAVSALFFPLLFWTWSMQGPLWGLAATAWASVLVGIAALISRRFILFWIIPEYLLFASITHCGFNRWKELHQTRLIDKERLEEEINTLRDEIKRLEEGAGGLQDRLERYQQLRQVTNAFSATLPLGELIQQIVSATGDLLEKADLVLLYVVEPKTLTLQLKGVWRRQGSITVKAKVGDLFDHWVMRQAQPLLVQESTHDFRFSQMTPKELGRNLGALVAVPLVSEDRFLGVLRAESESPHGLGPEDLRLVRIIGDLASLGIENSHLYSRMAELAITDDLTGLSVRQYFQKRLEEELVRAREFQKPLSLLLIDIDRFKSYNDSFGHSAGDKLLQILARLLTQARRAGEVVGRLGGEELGWFLPGVSLEEASKRAESFRTMVEGTSVELRRAMTHTTVSIGVAAFQQDGSTPDQLLKTADARLYQAKKQGRNQVCSI